MTELHVIRRNDTINKSIFHALDGTQVGNYTTNYSDPLRTFYRHL